MVTDDECSCTTLHNKKIHTIVRFQPKAYSSRLNWGHPYMYVLLGTYDNEDIFIFYAGS